MDRQKMLRGYVLSDKGLVRANNEDNYLLGHCLNENGDIHIASGSVSRVGEWICAGVFDGMGGAEGGEIASYEVANTFQRETMDIKDCTEDEIDSLMEKIFRLANDAVIDARIIHNTCGTTASVIATNGEKMRVYHRGDSRVYLKRKDMLYALSKDHTLAQLKLDVGIYHKADEVPEREFHQLTEFLGMEKASDNQKPFESEWIDLSDGDIMLICSDGVYDMCSDECIRQSLIIGKDLECVANDLMEKVFAKGATDNTTILLMKVE